MQTFKDTHVTIAAPLPEPMMDPWDRGDVRFSVGEDGDSTIGHSLERRDMQLVLDTGEEENKAAGFFAGAK